MPTSTIHDMRFLFEKDTPTAQCQPWCQPVDDHIRWCKCSGCEFAQSGMKIGDTCAIDPDLKCKPVDDNDLPFESCSTWCSERYLDSHCSMCACKLQAPPPTATTATPPPPPVVQGRMRLSGTEMQMQPGVAVGVPVA